MMSAMVLLVVLSFASPADVPSTGAPPANEALRFERVQYGDRVERDGGSTRTLDFRVRLITAQAVAEFGQIGMPYIEGLGDVQFQDVVIEKPDGRRVDLKDGRVEDVNPLGVSATSVPPDIRFRKLTLAGLEPGDILSYRIVHRQRPLAPGRVFGDFKFPPLPEGPLQTYELDLPRGGDITVRLRDGLGATWQEAPSPADRTVRRLTLKVELPTRKEREGQKERRQRNDPDVSFTNFRSWDDVSAWWWGLSKERMKPDSAAARQASDLTAGAGTVRDKVAALFAFVAGRVRYVNVSFRLGRMQPRPAAEVLQNRYGDCKDKHGLLAALAMAVGVDVRPVLINAATEDLHDDAPGPQQFDHLISVVRLGKEPSDWLWLDSTNPFSPPGYLLPPLRDKRALLVEADGAAVVVRTPKEPPFVPRHDATIKGALDAEGVLRAHAVWLVRSDTEPMLRAVMSSLPQERRASFIQESWLGDWGEATAREVSFSDPLETRSAFRVEFDVEAKLSTKDRERALTLPFPDLELPKAADPPVAGEPPVSFGVRDVAAHAEIEAAPGQMPRAPLSVSIERPFGSFRSTYSVEGRTLRMERILALRQGSLSEGDLPAYEAFRATVTTDSKQGFTIEGMDTLAGAAGVRSEGLAAFGRKDYAKAAELLRKAAEADPKTKDVFEDLGRALHELGRDEEAVAAFTRQIEITPFHESAYAWRAYALLALERGEEAEKDLLKQIEVAPFKAWSYEKLAERRRHEGRFAEAADFYGRAAAIEPTKAERWLDLGQAQAASAQPSEARRSLERAVSLDAPDWVRVRAAVTFHSLGDVARAGELAQGALPSIRKRLVDLTRDSFDEDDDYWMERLTEAWRLMGEAAAAAGDSARAQSYLQAAWKVSFSPEAAWALGDLREKEGRLAEAVELWTLAAGVPIARFALPADHRARIDAASRKLPRPVAAAGPRLMDLRTVRLTGPVSSDLTEEVLLLIDADGRVQTVLNVSRRDPKAFDRQIAKLGPIRAPWPRPDAEPVKVIRRALLVCATISGCSLVFDLPGTEALTAISKGSIRIVSLEPRDGTVLAPGQHVAVLATVHYELEGTGRVALVLQDETGPVPGASLDEAAATGAGDVTLKGTFTVPATATRIDLFLPLTAEGARVTSTVAGATYPVRR
jgi:tetratricopeptide (TPR) repeat protein